MNKKIPTLGLRSLLAKGNTIWAPPLVGTWGAQHSGRLKSEHMRSHLRRLSISEMEDGEQEVRTKRAICKNCSARVRARVRGRYTDSNALIGMDPRVQRMLAGATASIE